ncbi:MAG: PIN domain-containing protein [Zymomonas mobilis subsp. pomaceae]|uniref:PIN domain-containing protein n=1 Tax=Zymomonas mobilis TaxID=542 RepID=UPI0039E88241
MSIHRFTVFIDACSLASPLKRNLILSLAEANLFRLRWSAPVLDETQRAIEQILKQNGTSDSEANTRSIKARNCMESAFEDAMIEDFEGFLPACNDIPDLGDHHVLAAALKARSSAIVTENLKDFPDNILEPLNLVARSTDDFLVDIISLDIGRAVAAIKKMRGRFKKPEMTPEALLLRMDAIGLTETVDILQPYISSL